jgi:hypothetical protein
VRVRVGCAWRARVERHRCFFFVNGFTSLERWWYCCDRYEPCEKSTIVSVDMERKSVVYLEGCDENGSIPLVDSEES